MKVLIIEDEERAANQLERLLMDMEIEVEVMAKLESVKSALQYFKHNSQPQLIK